jgi:hypothetical protein
VFFPLVICYYLSTLLTLMLQTYSVEKRVRVCPPEADRAQSAYGGVLDPVRDTLSEASTVADGALSRERSGLYRCGFVTLGFSCRGGTGTLHHCASLFSHIGSRKTNPSHLSISSRDRRQEDQSSPCPQEGPGHCLTIWRVLLCYTGVAKELRHGLGNELAILVRHLNKVNSHPKCQDLTCPNHLSGNSKG